MQFKQPSLSFIHTISGQPHTEIWDYLREGCWRGSDFVAHETNTLRGIQNRVSRIAVLPNLIPLETGQKWNQDEKIIEEARFAPEHFECGLDKFLERSKSFFGKFNGKHIGVQLSGGVDSSLIIGLLKYFGIPHSLIGYYTERYEFRTEFFIQRLLANESHNSKLLNYEEYLPYSGYIEIPAHQYPNLSSCGLATDRGMVLGCRNLGIEVLITGCGGDVAFGNEVSSEKNTWIPAIFNDSWLQDMLFAPQGVKLVSFFSDHDILECIWNLRREQKSDPKKLWARNFFRDFLPKELVDFTYKADFWGFYIDGLNNSLPEIRNIHKQAYELSRNPYFEEDNLNQILKNDLYNCNQKLYQKLEARISSAVWINSLPKKFF